MLIWKHRYQIIILGCSVQVKSWLDLWGVDVLRL